MSSGGVYVQGVSQRGRVGYSKGVGYPRWVGIPEVVGGGYLMAATKTHMVGKQAVCILLECFVITARKRWQGNIFRSVCQSFCSILSKGVLSLEGGAILSRMCHP